MCDDICLTRTVKVIVIFIFFMYANKLWYIKKIYIFKLSNI